MKKKIFFIIASLGTGGSERVYWLLSQYFNNPGYAVSVVLLNGAEPAFSTDIKGIRFIVLGTVKASRSFFKLYNLLKAERPFAVFSTTDHMNILTSTVGCFLKIPKMIARASNNPQEMKDFFGFKMRFYNLFSRIMFCKFDFIVCQSAYMKQSLNYYYKVPNEKLKVIANPVLQTPIIKNPSNTNEKHQLIAVARMSGEKGLFRLLDVMQQLPQQYVLTIAGEGPLMDSLKSAINNNEYLAERVVLIGKIKEVPKHIAQHDVLLLSSFTEGFPNVVLEALTVGVPVVTFEVGGVLEIIKEGFNGFVVKQNDVAGFKNKIVQACNMEWSRQQIKADVYNRYDLTRIGRQFEALITE
jgi:glycosyltransferase involved in cell wall biosynthesis